MKMKKGSTILKSEVIKVIKDLGRKKAIGDDKIPVDLLKELGDSGIGNNDCTG